MNLRCAGELEVGMALRSLRAKRHVFLGDCGESRLGLLVHALEALCTPDVEGCGP